MKEIVVDGQVLVVFLHSPPRVDNALLSVEIPSCVVVGELHVAKAVEEALYAARRGKALRDIRLEVLRRLLLRRQVKDVKELIDDLACKDKCVVTVLEKTSSLQRMLEGEKVLTNPCTLSMSEAARLILGEELVGKVKRLDELERLIVALISLTRIDKWIRL